MPELLLELLSEEIPARMQQGAAADLGRLLTEALGSLAPAITTFHGPRRIAAVAQLAAEVPAASRSERGPRATAPDAALTGFLRKHGAERERLVVEDGYWVLHVATPARPAASLIAAVLPGVLRRFPWPKSMRWGGSSSFTWVRPLRRILCLLDGEVVTFDLRDGADDGHGLASGDLTEGHRFMAPGAFAVRSAEHWQQALRERGVIVDPVERSRRISEDLARAVAHHAPGLTLVQDIALQDEVTGLVEWPVPLLGRIDPDFMDLPPEVMQVSMRVNQRYFALRDACGAAAPYFAFVANIAAPDGGAAIIAGNERVLRARFADARHFWDADRAARLESRLPALGGIVFHARLGSQLDRARRLQKLSAVIAPLVGAEPAAASRAGLLAKADLTTGMVGEFPELQGIMGGYYARADGEDAAVAEAISMHYRMPVFGEAGPIGPVALALALADRLDTLAGFFGIGETPTGSGDPYALRRAALGVIAYATRPGMSLPLRQMITHAAEPFADRADPDQLFAFIVDRLRVALRAQGERHDILAAVFASANSDDLAWLIARTRQLSAVIAGEHGPNLLAGYKRAANILRIETRKDGPHDGAVSESLLSTESEARLHARLNALEPVLRASAAADGSAAMAGLAGLRQPLDAFFNEVLVNDPNRPELRANRLRLLASVVRGMDMIADFSKIDG